MLSKKVLIIAIIATILLIGGGSFYWLSTASSSVGKLQVYKGKAEILRNETLEVAVTGREIRVEDTIKTSSDSRVALILTDGTVIRLKEGSVLEVAELSYKGEKLKKAHLKITSGQAWSRVKPLDSDSQFEVETPSVTASVRGTIFNTTLENNDTGFYVDSHSVSIRHKELQKEQIVSESKILWMNNDRLVEEFRDGQKDLPENFLQDEWVRFNKAEDELLCKQNNYIPECDEKTSPPTTTPTREPSKVPTPTTPVKRIIPPTKTPTPSLTPTTQPTSVPTATPYPTMTPTPTRPVPTPTPTITPTPTFYLR